MTCANDKHMNYVYVINGTGEISGHRRWMGLPTLATRLPETDLFTRLAVFHGDPSYFMDLIFCYYYYYFVR